MKLSIMPAMFLALVIFAVLGAAAPVKVEPEGVYYHSAHFNELLLIMTMIVNCDSNSTETDFKGAACP